MRLLLAGFEPFGGARENPSQLLVERLAPTPLVLPVSYGRAWPVLRAAVEAMRPDTVVLTGLAADRSVLSVERLAVNLDDAAAPDNDGQVRHDSPIVPDGPAAYFATVSVRAMVEAATAAGVTAAPSLSAGTFLCNHAFYCLCHHEAAAPTRCGFVHVPPLSPEFSLDSIERGVRAMLAALERG